MAVQINEVTVKATVCEKPRVCKPDGSTDASEGEGGNASTNEIVERVLEILRNSLER